jgi:hypothetical protein
MNVAMANAYEYGSVDDGPNSREMAVSGSRLKKSATNCQIDNQHAFLNAITDSTLNEERVQKPAASERLMRERPDRSRHSRVKNSSCKSSKTKEGPPADVALPVGSDQAVRSGWNSRGRVLGTAGGHGAATGVADNAIAQQRPGKCCEPTDTSAD